jgi:hypothetical protein
MEIWGIKNSGGEGGIRTPGTSFSSYNGLANRPIKPLWHLSSNISNTLAQFSSWLGALLVHYNSENTAAAHRQRKISRVKSMRAFHPIGRGGRENRLRQFRVYRFQEFSNSEREIDRGVACSGRGGEA